MTPPSRRWIRVVLALGIVAGVANAVQLAHLSPEQVGIATDVYYHAATKALAGEPFYQTAPAAHPGYHFVYQPVIVVAFVPYALLGDPTAAYALATAGNLATAAALGLVMLRAIETAGVRLPPLDRLLVVGFAGGSAGAASTIVQGQVNLQLALAIAAGVLLIEADRGAVGGSLLAVAAAVKLFPVVVGAWLLRRRAWRAIAGATATGLGLLLASVALFGPETMATWLTGTLAQEASVGTFAGGPDPDSSLLTIRRQLAVLAPWLPGTWLLPVGALLLAPVVLAASWRVDTYRQRLVALQATLLAMLIVFPLEPFYLSLAIFPLVPLVYLIEPEYRTTRRLLLAGTLVASVPVWLSSVEWLIAVAPLPPALTASGFALARAAFAFALPQMYGVWLLFAACIRYQQRS